MHYAYRIYYLIKKEAFPVAHIHYSVTTIYFLNDFEESWWSLASFRDIPMPLVSSGVEHGNLRELALARMKDMGTEVTLIINHLVCLMYEFKAIKYKLLLIPAV